MLSILRHILRTLKYNPNLPPGDLYKFRVLVEVTERVIFQKASHISESPNFKNGIIGKRD